MRAAQSLTGHSLGAELFAGDRAHQVIAGLPDDVATGDAARSH
jgi:hypothetical protein